MKHTILISITLFSILYCQDDNLVAHWSFDNNVDDNMGNIQATIIGDIDYFYDSRFGNVLDLERSNFIKFDADALPSGNSPRTIAVWVYSLAEHPTQSVVGWGGSGCCIKNFRIDMISNGQFEFDSGNLNSSFRSNYFSDYFKSYWIHIAVTYDSETIRMYINGELDIEEHLEMELDTRTTFGAIGRIPAYSDDWFEGYIDDVRIYDIALSEEEISHLLIPEPNRYYGTNDDDYLEGTNGEDYIYGIDGDDEIIGHKTSDVLKGGEGDDIITGGDGHDKIYGDAGDDVIYSGSGKDVIKGGDGYDTVHFPSKKQKYSFDWKGDHWVIKKKNDGSDKTKVYDCEWAVFKNAEVNLER